MTALYTSATIYHSQTIIIDIGPITMKNSFHFLREQDADTYVECYGIDFEDFEIGQIFEHRPGRTFTAEECIRHALHSLDLRPQFSDQHYAHSAFGHRPQVMETYILACLAMTTKTFGKVVANLGMMNITLKPVYVGDTIYFESEILGKRDSASRQDQGIMHIQTRAYNQNKEEVSSFERKFLIYRKNFGPYKEVGY